MRTCIPPLLLLALALGCRPSGQSDVRDTAAVPDTTAVQGAGSVPHPSPAAADSAARDSAARTRRP